MSPEDHNKHRITKSKTFRKSSGSQDVGQAPMMGLRATAGGFIKYGVKLS